MPQTRPNIPAHAHDLAMLTLVLSLLASLFSVVHANHYTCSFQGPGNNPETDGYELFCDATVTEQNQTHAQYNCHWPNGKTSMVADYGYLADFALEFATPCGGGGYTGRSSYGSHPLSHLPLTLQLPLP